jgi:hypothetical protein
MKFIGLQLQTILLCALICVVIYLSYSVWRLQKEVNSQKNSAITIMMDTLIKTLSKPIPVAATTEETETATEIVKEEVKVENIPVTQPEVKK